MLRSKNRKKTLGQQIIDLTPLLDVIFILLLIVYSTSSQDIKQAEDNKQNIEDQNATQDDHEDTINNIYDYVDVVTVFAGYQPSNRKERILYVNINDKKEEPIHFNSTNEAKIWEDCLETINQNVTGDNPVVFSIVSENDEKMLYRDQQQLKKIYEELNFVHKVLKDNSIEVEEETENE